MLYGTFYTFILSWPVNVDFQSHVTMYNIQNMHNIHNMQNMHNMPIMHNMHIMHDMQKMHNMHTILYSNNLDSGPKDFNKL